MKLSEANIRTGDVVLFSGSLYRPYTIAIWMRTWQAYTHAGIFHWVAVNGRKVLTVIESVEGQGVRVEPAEAYIRKCNQQKCGVHWFPVRDDVGINREHVADYAVSRWEAAAAYPSWHKLISSFGYFTPWFRRKLDLEGDVNPDQHVCSEFVAHAMVAGGFTFDEVAVKEFDKIHPGVVATFPCIHREGLLEA